MLTTDQLWAMRKNRYRVWQSIADRSGSLRSVMIARLYCLELDREIVRRTDPANVYTYDRRIEEIRKALNSKPGLRCLDVRRDYCA